MIKTHQKREPVFTSTAIFPEDTRDPHIPYRKNRNSFFLREDSRTNIEESGDVFE